MFTFLSFFLSFCPLQRRVLFCAVAMGSTQGGAVSVTAGGRAQSVTFPAASVLTCCVGVTVCVCVAPVCATPATKARAAIKVSGQMPPLLVPLSPW